MNANSILTVVFGWVPSFVSSVWDWFSGKGNSGIFAWFAEHWKAFVLGIAILALVVDLVIYLIRWRPYRVWISFFRRIRHPARPSDPDVYWDRRVPEPQPWPQTVPAAADNMMPLSESQPYMPEYDSIPEETQVRIPTAIPEPISQTYPAEAWQQPELETSHVPLVYREIPGESQAWSDEAMDEYAVSQAYGGMAMEPDVEVPRTRRSSGKHNPSRSRVGGLFRSMNADTEEQPHIRYQAPQPAVNHEDAYNAPYIPPQWQDPGSAGTGMPRRRRAQP